MIIFIEFEIFYSNSASFVSILAANQSASGRTNTATNTNSIYINNIA